MKPKVILNFPLDLRTAVFLNQPSDHVTSTDLDALRPRDVAAGNTIKNTKCIELSAIWRGTCELGCDHLSKFALHVKMESFQNKRQLGKQ